MARWYDETFEGNLRLGLWGGRTLFRDRSAFQTVEIFETERYGRVLALDGAFMTSEVDEFFYHEMLVHPAMTTAQAITRVLIVGGGDGGSARRVLGYPEVEEVVLVELDPMVVEAAREHLPAIGPSWDDPRLHLRFEDGTAFVAREGGAAFDVILIDGSDPVGPAKGLFARDFFAHLADRLAPGGVLAMQSESPLLFPRVFRETQEGLRGLLGSVHPYFGPVPLYPSGIWSYTWASRDGDPRVPRPDRLASGAHACRYYNAEIHRAAFAQPTYVRELLGPRARAPSGHCEPRPGAYGGIMATHVREIMNREVFSLHPMDSVATAIGGLAAMGITGAPVVDSMGVVTGMVSLRTLVAATEATTVVDCATVPAVSVGKDATIEEAARLLGTKGIHRVPVVDADGRPIGIVSSLDLLRAMLGLPVSHPAAFPRLHEELGVEMTDPATLEEEEIERAPDGRGVIVLIHGRYGAPELPLWAELTEDVRARLSDMLAAPQADYGLQRILTHDRAHLRFRVAPVSDPGVAAALLSRLKARLASGLPTVAAGSLA